MQDRYYDDTFAGDFSKALEDIQNLDYVNLCVLQASPEVEAAPLSEDPSVDALNPLGTNTVEYKSDPSAYAEILKETSRQYNAVIQAYEQLEADFVA